MATTTEDDASGLLLAAFERRLRELLSDDDIARCREAAIADVASQLQPRRASATHHHRLVLAHDCENVGCNLDGCALCSNNPSRLCTRNLHALYYEDDALRARCGASIRVRAIAKSGGDKASSDEPPPRPRLVELRLLSDDRYARLVAKLPSRHPSAEQLWSCLVPPPAGRQGEPPLLLLNHRTADPTLQHDDRVYLRLDDNGEAALDPVLVVKSSEVMLGVRVAYRLWIRGDDVDHVVSEPFVVTTRRCRVEQKAELPHASEPVSKLVHMGHKTKLKLEALDATLRSVGGRWAVRAPPGLEVIRTVGDLRRLLQCCDADAALDQAVVRALCMSREKWKLVREHVMRAVDTDARPRVWSSEDGAVHLLYECVSNGTIDPRQPSSASFAADAAQLVPVESLAVGTAARRAVDAAIDGAERSWWQPGHPGWAILHDRGPGAAQPVVVSSCLKRTAGDAGLLPSEEDGGEEEEEEHDEFLRMAERLLFVPDDDWGLLSP